MHDIQHYLILKLADIMYIARFDHKMAMKQPISTNDAYLESWEFDEFDSVIENTIQFKIMGIKFHFIYILHWIISIVFINNVFIFQQKKHCTMIKTTIYYMKVWCILPAYQKET